MKEAIKKASDMNDDYMNTTLKKFIKYLEKNNKLSIMTFSIDSSFLSNVISNSDSDDSCSEDDNDIMY